MTGLCVITDGNASGIAATASDIAVSNISMGCSPRNQPTIKMIAHTIRMMIER